MKRSWLLIPLFALSLGLLPAVTGDPGAVEPEQDESVPDAAEKREAEEEAPESAVTERVVVSASASDETLLDAPAAVTVIDSDTLSQQAGDQLVDYFRRVPGVNVVQFSARDVNISSRSSTGGINNSTLALTDGRSLYQDFLGFVMWEFAPSDLSMVDRVEVVRGPASSLWGANAVGGLVHVITKSPRQTLGGKLSMEVGEYDARKIDFTQSFLAGPWALRVSGGYRESDAFPRPQVVTNFLGETIDPDLGLIEDGFRDSGTRQPRFDIRADWEDPGGAQWILQGGWARTRGWITTGLGPFDIDPGTSSSYLQARYRRGPIEAQMVSSYFDGSAVNGINALPFGFTSTATSATLHGRTLIGSRGVVGWGGELSRSTYNLSIAPEADKRSKAAAFAELDCILTDRLKLVTGARLDYVRETIGAVLSPRLALRYKPTENQTLRTAWGQAFRSPSVIESDLYVPVIPVALLEWEEIDRQLFANNTAGVPDLDPDPDVEGFLAVMARFICAMRPDNCGVPAGETPDYIAVTAATGTRELEEEETQSYEVGYAGQFGGFSVSLSAYRTRTKNGIDFPIQESYGVGADGIGGTADDIYLPTDPDGDGLLEAPPIDVCPGGISVIGEPFDRLCASGPVPYNEALSYLLDGEIPSRFGYQNGAIAQNQGIEVGLSLATRRGFSAFLNYSWQDDPRSAGVSMADRVEQVQAEESAQQDLDGDGIIGDTFEFVNIPAEHRVSFGVQTDRPRWFGGVSLDYVDGTFWQDVLTSDFWGFVDSYSLVGVRGGWRWPDQGLEITAQVTNLLDDQIQQHIYGDIIGRRASLALNWSWDRHGAAASRPAP